MTDQPDLPRITLDLTPDIEAFNRALATAGERVVQMRNKFRVRGLMASALLAALDLDDERLVDILSGLDREQLEQVFAAASALGIAAGRALDDGDQDDERERAILNALAEVEGQRDEQRQRAERAEAAVVRVRGERDTAREHARALRVDLDNQHEETRRQTERADRAEADTCGLLQAHNANSHTIATWQQRAEKAEAKVAALMDQDGAEQIERIQAERAAMPRDERARLDAADAPMLRIQLAVKAREVAEAKAEMERTSTAAAREIWVKMGFDTILMWKGRAEQAEAALQRAHDTHRQACPGMYACPMCAALAPAEDPPVTT